MLTKDKILSKSTYKVRVYDKICRGDKILLMGYFPEIERQRDYIKYRPLIA